TVEDIMPVNDPPGVLQALDRHARNLCEHPAVISSAGVTTYGELHRMAGDFGRAISNAGLGPGRVLAVAVDDGPVAVAAMLGALRAGAPAVWLHADLPRERRSAIVADCRPAALLVDDESAGVLPPDHTLIRSGSDGSIVVNHVADELPVAP